MPEYRVVWEIDLEAVDAEGAARMARAIQLRADSTATVFDVKARGHVMGQPLTVRVDLDELDADDVGVALEALEAAGLIETVDTWGADAVQETSP